MNDKWLRLNAVADILGIHPSTVRTWSDKGELPVHRTKGGHRRFRRSELELWMQSQRANGPDEARLVVQNALKSTRMKISEGNLNAESWYAKLDDEARKRYRRSGRSLLQGLTGFLASHGVDAEAEAKALGYEYASRGQRNGLSKVDAVHAFLFFRNLLIESMLKVYESASVRSPYAWSDMFRRINAFTDEILTTLLETYEAFNKNAK